MKKLWVALLLAAFSCNNNELYAQNINGGINNPGAAGAIPSLPVPIAQGGTGATTAGGALDSLASPTTLGGQWLNRTATGTYTTQAARTVLGTCYMADFDPAFASKSETAQGTSIQNAMLDCQKKAIDLGAANKADLIIPACMKFSMMGLSEFGVSINTNMVIPKYVCPDESVSFIRDGHLGTPIANWNGDTTTKSLSNLWEPAILFPPNGQTYGPIRIVGNSNGSDRGSAWWYGKTWRIAYLTPRNGGTGFVGGESCSVINGDTKAPATKATFTCSHATAGACDRVAFPTELTTNGTTAAGNATLHFAASGTSCTAGQLIYDLTTPSAIAANTTVSSSAATTVTMSANAAGAGVGSGDIIDCNNTQFATATGQYPLPPFQQRQQYQVSGTCDAAHSSSGNNECWDGHDSLHPQVFDNDVNKYYVTSCSGAGAGLTVSAKFWPDWCSNAAADSDSVSCPIVATGPNGTNVYDGLFGNFSASTGYLAQVYAEQSGNTLSATYGWTMAGGFEGKELNSPYLQTQSSHYGLLGDGSDIVIGQHNDVSSAVQEKWFGGASLHDLYGRLDTPLDVAGNDAHALEVDKNAGDSDWKGTIFHNSGSAATLGTIQARFGYDTTFSDSVDENVGFIFGPTSFSSDGTGGSALTAVGCQYTRDSLFIANVSNLQRSGSARSQQYTHMMDVGTNCENSNFLIGQIDNVSGNLFSTATNGFGTLVWDAYAQGFATPYGTYLMYTNGAPTNNVTGLNKAGPGSMAIDYTNGALYINTTASSGPTWAAPRVITNQQRTFQISGTLAVANDLTNWIIMPAAGSWTKFYAVCKTGPTTSAAIFDIQKSTNNGSSFTSIWNITPASKIQIAAAAVAGTTTSFDTASFNAGDVFRIDVDQIGSGTAGANCSIMGVASY